MSNNFPPLLPYWSSGTGTVTARTLHYVERTILSSAPLNRFNWIIAMSGMGSRIINRIIPMRTFNYYRHGDEDINLLQACYENPLFDEDGTVLNDSRRKVPGQVDGIRTKNLEVNSVQTAVHYSPSYSSKKRALKVLGVIVAILAIIGLIVGIIVGQRQGKWKFELKICYCMLTCYINKCHLKKIIIVFLCFF